MDGAVRMKIYPPLNNERRSKPEGFHSARKPKGHPRRQARRDRAAARLAAKA